MCLSGYEEGSFSLYWRRHDNKDENDEKDEKDRNDELLEWKSSATLHEINMPTEPTKVKTFIRHKEDGSLPVKTIVVSFP